MGQWVRTCNLSLRRSAGTMSCRLGCSEPVSGVLDVHWLAWVVLNGWNSTFFGGGECVTELKGGAIEWVGVCD